MARTSPTVAGWELMLRIREQSKAVGVKATAIQSALDISAAYWSQVANYRGVFTEAKLRILMELLDFEPDEQQELLELRSIARQRGWWSEYSALFNDSQLRFYGLEDGAQRIRSVEGGVIPGLLQSEDYIRALMSSIVYTARPTEVQQRIRARLLRQQRLNHPDALQLSVVVGQSALMQEVGGPEVQRNQLRHLCQLADKYSDNLDLRVIPFNARGSIAGLNAATYHLLDFDSPRLPPLGWIDTAIYGEIVEDQRKVEALDYLFNQLQTIALNRDDSLRLIDDIASRIV
ncbi:DUF5753 domain-containing protein [Nocardia sp. CDC160]|uniref:DUF5753 domain-containing protein n=1 Tax=Nocardia sp. CDC160 TaxID=3112166 RepID=UPI002DB9F385|nr:DUF5753 domain-containing protein [Nocardia sp. CDC160]MEC3913300.1 DUF5753 domain-containing protein [Nocardia sp. CDC160]